MSVVLLLDVIEGAEQIVLTCIDEESKHMWMVFMSYAVIKYVLSLQENEGLLLDLKGFYVNWANNDGTYTVVSLLGKIKGETLIKLISYHDPMHQDQVDNCTFFTKEIITRFANRTSHFKYK